MLWIDNLIPRPRFSPQDEAGRPGELLFHPLLVGQGQAVVESVEPAAEVSCLFPNQIRRP